MKKIILTTLAIFLAYITQAQCWIIPQGATVYNEQSQIPNEVKLDGNNAYVEGDVTFKNIKFSGTDTLFIHGNTIVTNKIQSNNSEKGVFSRVIIISDGSTLTINNVSYIAGDIINESSKKQKEIYIKSCSQTLPIEISSINISNGVLQWKMGVQTNVKEFVIQGSNNVKNWNNIDVIKPNNYGRYVYSFKSDVLASFSIFIVLLLLSFAVSFKKVKASIMLLIFSCGVIISCSKKVDVQKTTDYKYYRIKVIKTNGDFNYSNIIYK